MLANLLLFTYQKTSEDQIANEQPLIQIGFLRITSFAVIMGIIGAVITIPVNLLIVIIFSQRRHRQSSHGIERDTTDKYRLQQRPHWIDLDSEFEEENNPSRYSNIHCVIVLYFTSFVTLGTHNL